MREVKNSIKRLRSFAIKTLGFIGIGFSFMTMTRLSEEFGGINDQIRDATRDMGDQQEIQQRILQAANDTRQSYAQMANTINRLAMTNAFGDIEEAAQFATLMAKDFAAAGKSQYKSAYLTRYITMDLQKGSVSARTLSTALRDAPHIINRMAEYLDVSVENLQDMARSGELTADVLKSSFFDSSEDINARFAETDKTISDAMTNVRNTWGLFLAEMDDTLGISSMVARGIVRGFNQVMFVLRRVADMFSRIADRMGGVHNLMRLLAVAAGAIFIALKADAILKFIRKLGVGLKAINKKMIFAKLKVLAIVAVIILLALLIDDFLAFMRGDDSLLGELLEKFGVDAYAVREIIFDLWDIIRGIIPFILELAKSFGGLLVDALRLILPLFLNLLRQILPPLIDLIRRLLPMVFSIIENIIPVFITLIEQLLPIVFQIIESVLPVIIHLIEQLIPIILEIIEKVLPIVIGLIEKFLSVALPIIEMMLPILVNLLEGLIPLITFVAELLGNVLAAAFEGLVPIIDAVMKIFSRFIDFISGVFTGDWERAWQGIRNIFEGIISGLAAIFKLPINMIITGINTFISGLNRISIPDWIPVVGGKSIDIPKIPMLAKGSDFSPDTFIAGEEGPELVTNAKGSKVFTAAETADTLGKLNALANWELPKFTDYKNASSNNEANLPGKKSYANAGLTGWISDLAIAVTTPAYEAVKTYHSHIENKYITQYNEFYNEFHGDRAGQERSSEAMDKAADDAMGELARALAYVR